MATAFATRIYTRLTDAIPHLVRRLIRERVLAAEQVVRGAPYQIRASDLQDGRVAEAIERKARPDRAEQPDQISMFSVT